MTEPRACPSCLRRAWLVGGLSNAIERALESRPASRARELLALEDAELSAAVAGADAESISERAERRDSRRLREAVRGSHCWACCRHDDAYPDPLRDLGDSPAVLFGRGDPVLLARLAGREDAATVVGSRRASGYGRDLATRLGAELASAELAIVSGMAIGIDSCAHRGALDAGGVTVAVLGSGADIASPPRMQGLYEEIRAAGLVISELPPGTEARRWTFPARNRIMAALGAITIVVEARHGSGSLITADIAEDLNRDVGAVPGLVGSSPAAGTNDLIHDGAHLIRGGRDVLDALVGPGTLGEPDGDRVPADLDPGLAAVLDAVSTGAGTQDEIARESGLGPESVAVALTRLELRELVASDAAGRYRARPPRV
ncbi:MAG: DNA-processing protein DprA [Solirubrobacterales bacterium]